jgi:hypothetical protein
LCTSFNHTVTKVVGVFVRFRAPLQMMMYDKIGENYRQFSFTTSGYVEIIAFGEIQIWCSEDSSRKWLTKTKDYEPFKPFIKRMYKRK